MKESFELKTNKEKSYEEIERVTKELIEKHQDEIFSSHDEDLQEYIDEISNDVLEKYWGHGITRGNTEDRLVSIICALETHSIKGMAGRLGSGAYSAYTSGPVMIISKPGKELFIKKEGKPIIREIAKNNSDSIKAGMVDIGMVVLNDQFYSLYDDLRKMYPDIKIIKANQLPEELK